LEGLLCNPAVDKRSIIAITLKKELMMELVVTEQEMLMVVIVVDENLEFSEKLSTFARVFGTDRTQICWARFDTKNGLPPKAYYDTRG
jgi:hypothetical protein